MPEKPKTEQEVVQEVESRIFKPELLDYLRNNPAHGYVYVSVRFKQIELLHTGIEAITATLARVVSEQHEFRELMKKK